MVTNAGDVDGQDNTKYYRSSKVRYGANCPGILELTFFNKEKYLALTGAIVNISSSGCLFSNDRTPWREMVLRQSGEQIFNIIDEQCRVYIPWNNTHCDGRIKRVGAYIVGVQFKRPLDETLVKDIANMEPEQGRRFKPKTSGKYNRIIPMAEMESVIATRRSGRRP